jgi:hypothetical protein
MSTMHGAGVVEGPPGAQPVSMRHSSNVAIHSPDTLVAAVPYLLGFIPLESLIVVWLDGSRVLVTQRADLPVESATGGGVEFAEALVRPLRAHSPSGAVILIASGDGLVGMVGMVGHERNGPVLELPHAALAAAVIAAIEDMGIDVLDALLVHGDRYWSYCCEGTCCPAEGRSVDPVVATAVAANFVIRGVVALDSREEVMAVLAHDALAANRIEPLLIEAEQDLGLVLGSGEPEILERWRDDSIDVISALVIGGEELCDAGVVEVLLGLSDVRVRDTLAWQISRTADRHGALDVLCHITRVAPEGYVAAVATCAGITAWLLGDGAKASTAVGRALVDDPAYSLALLIATSLAAGLPPASWGEAMAEMTREQCRMRPPAA